MNVEEKSPFGASCLYFQVFGEILQLSRPPHVESGGGEKQKSESCRQGEHSAEVSQKKLPVEIEDIVKKLGPLAEIVPVLQIKIKNSGGRFRLDSYRVGLQIDSTHPFPWLKLLGRRQIDFLQGLKGAGLFEVAVQIVHQIIFQGENHAGTAHEGKDEAQGESQEAVNFGQSSAVDHSSMSWKDFFDSNGSR